VSLVSSLRRFAGLGAALVALRAPVARAQSPHGGATSDSMDVVGHAHDAQRDFELFRRANLPPELNPRGHGCDVRIGRFCYWYDPGPDPAPPDPEIVVHARGRLLDVLRTAAERLPADDWITGQLVRYLVEQGHADSALAVTERCRATRWWCDALDGFVRHMARDYEGADAAFARALQHMPEVERCAWTDLGPLLDDDRTYRKLPCAARDSVNERIWWLARPLYSRAGNDLRTEHYARLTMAHLLEDTETTEGDVWGTDTRELVLRFGWPTHWTSAFEGLGSEFRVPIFGHEPDPSFWFLPTPAVPAPWDDPTEVGWDPARERPPARYAPPYAAEFDPIERVQFARFRRGDSTITLAAYDLSADSVMGIRPTDVRLAVSRDPATPAAVGSLATTRPRGFVRVSSGWRPAVVSLEVVGRDPSWIARRRAVAPPDPGGLPLDISDVLLFTPGNDLPGSLEAALASALATTVLRRSDRVGLYWELYEQPDSTVPLEIGVTAMKSSAKDDTPYPVGRPSCPFAAAAPVKLRWVEEPEVRRRGAGRSVALDLRSLSPGRYVIAVQFTVGGLPRGCSSREIRIAG